MSRAHDPAAIAEDLDRLGDREPRIAAAVAQLGYPPPRVREPGFETLMRILVGQQVSTRAADGIWTTLSTHLGVVTAESVRAADTLPGLSRAKIRYARALADAVLAGSLDLDRLDTLDDAAAIETITAVTGFGPWSADIYLLFALGRPDIWPAGDLAVRAGLATILELDPVPDARAAVPLGDPFRPHRSALALLCWHAYSSPTFGTD
ncbi:MAG: DNA-3-methyladenine glycosylase 2 family protein [Acidobacteriota bacterium]